MKLQSQENVFHELVRRSETVPEHWNQLSMNHDRHTQAAGQGCALLRITMCFKRIRRGLPTIISFIMVGFYLQCAWRCPNNVPIGINSHRHTWNVDSTTLSLENAIHSPTRNLTANVFTIPNNTSIQQDVKPCPETPPFLRKYLCALWSHFVDVE